MCGRYQVVTEESELREIIFDAFKNSHMSIENVQSGEIFPTYQMPVIVGNAGQRFAKLSKWGFPQYKGKGVIINARSETAEQKPSFASRLKYTRCAVPSSGFYEWSHDSAKTKYLFRLPDDNVLYMAGIHGDFAGESRYVILTGAANESMNGIHDRMPLILRRQDIDTWLFDTTQAMKMLHSAIPQLVKTEINL